MKQFNAMPALLIVPYGIETEVYRDRLPAGLFF